MSDLNWSKPVTTTGKIEPWPQFLAEEKFTFQRAISTPISNLDAPKFLVLKIDQTTLSYVSPGQYTFSFKGSKNISIKGGDDRRQITGIFAVSSKGKFLPIQSIYTGTKPHSLRKCDFPVLLSVGFTKNHWSNTDKSIEIFEQFLRYSNEKCKSKLLII